MLLGRNVSLVTPSSRCVNKNMDAGVVGAGGGGRGLVCVCVEGGGVLVL